MNKTKLAKDVRFLKIYAVVATLLCMVFLLTAFSVQEKNKKFAEIDVERINIVESDGKLRMVISNKARQHPGIINGKIIKREHPRPAGMIFFNHLGDEMGGLIFGENGGKGHFGSITWDKVRNDQAIGFRYLESDNGTYQSGLEMWQRPDIPADVVNEKYEAARKIKDKKERDAAIQAMVDSGEFGVPRLFLGKRRDNSSGLIVGDTNGNIRIKLRVAPDGTPKLEFLDEKGKVVLSLPDETKTKDQ